MLSELNSGSIYAHDSLNAPLHSCFIYLFIYFLASGALGCVANVYSSNTSQIYISLYNYDTTLTSSVTYRFTCVVSNIVSYVPHDINHW